MKKLIIAVDFDNTIVTDAYPQIGYPIGAFPVLKLLQSKGHHIYLYSCRQDHLLAQACDYCESKGLHISTSHECWSMEDHPYSKQYFDILIDDHAFNCPTTIINNQRVVYWTRIALWLGENDYITREEYLQLYDDINKEIRDSLSRINASKGLS